MRFKAGDKVRVAAVARKLPNGEIKIYRDEIYTVESYDPRDGWVSCTPRPELSSYHIFHLKAVQKIS